MPLLLEQCLPARERVTRRSFSPRVLGRLCCPVGGRGSGRRPTPCENSLADSLLKGFVLSLDLLGLVGFEGSKRSRELLVATGEDLDSE